MRALLFAALVMTRCYGTSEYPGVEIDHTPPAVDAGISLPEYHDLGGSETPPGNT